MSEVLYFLWRTSHGGRYVFKQSMIRLEHPKLFNDVIIIATDLSDHEAEALQTLMNAGVDDGTND